MATRTDTFEGYYDHYSGWEFDMPVVMVKPAYYFGIGGNTGKIDDIIENWMIDESLGDHRPPSQIPADVREQKAATRIFNRVKRDPRVRKGATYWKRVIRWDTETMAQEVLESVNG